jgi:hypothetical protein
VDDTTNAITAVAAGVARVHEVSDTNLVTSPNATDLTTAQDLVNEIKADFNAHLANLDGASTTSVADTAAFTTVNSLVGATITFDAATTTVALRGQTATVISNTEDILTLSSALPAAPVTGDEFTVEFTAVDADISAMRGAKATGDTYSNPYSSGPNMINSLAKIIIGLGATPPTYMDTQAKITALAEAFGIGNPHAGAGSLGHGGAQILADMLLVARNAVEAYTVPT